MSNIQSIFQRAADEAVANGELGIQIAVYKDGQLVASAFSGLADEESGRQVNETTLFNSFSRCKAITNTALHLQAARGLIDYDAPVAATGPNSG
jgi:CubicO group peptidase (beta-lactamase class C family)